MDTYSFAKSQELFARATKVIPCGIPGHFSPAPLVPPTAYPFFAASGKGAHFTDVDGNDFIDYMCAYGPMVLGYDNKVVHDAAAKQRKLGDTLAAPAPVMVELAEKLTSMIAAADWAFFAKNGGDMTNYATMIARTATGRPLIVAIEGGYHGVAPWMQGAGHHGVIAGDVAGFVRIPWNDVEAFERLHVVPGDADEAGHVAGDDAVVAGPLHPGRHAVVAALDGDDEGAAGGRPGDHRRVVGHVAAVLGEERPVGGGDHRGELLGQLDHHRRGGGERVAQLALLGGGVVHHLVVVAQDHRPVGAHVVDEVVAVDVGEVRALAAGGEERVRGRRHQRRRAEVAGDAAGDHLGRAGEELL